MVHPDYQYTPKLIPAMASMIGNGLYHCVIGSRILGGYALKGGMPLYKYISNRFLTFVENILNGAKLSEYQTGYRAFSRELLEQLSLEVNSDDFVFDNQMLAQIVWCATLSPRSTVQQPFPGSILNQPAPKHQIRFRMFAHCPQISSCKDEEHRFKVIS